MVSAIERFHCNDIVYGFKVELMVSKLVVLMSQGPRWFNLQGLNKNPQV